MIQGLFGYCKSLVILDPRFHIVLYVFLPSVLVCSPEIQDCFSALMFFPRFLMLSCVFLFFVHSYFKVGTDPISYRFFLSSKFFIKCILDYFHVFFIKKKCLLQPFLPQFIFMLNNSQRTITAVFQNRLKCNTFM